ncbi:MAG: hypothetical protein OHK0019_25900 [Saprospiraceae bacterium]
MPFGFVGGSAPNLPPGSNVRVPVFGGGKPYTNVKIRLPFFYKFVRHPLYLGFLIAFWAAPVMTVKHFFFAVMTPGYILTAIQLEERDLILALRRQLPQVQKVGADADSFH